MQTYCCAYITPWLTLTVILQFHKKIDCGAAVAVVLACPAAVPSLNMVRQGESFSLLNKLRPSGRNTGHRNHRSHATIRSVKEDRFSISLMCMRNKPHCFTFRLFFPERKMKPNSHVLNGYCLTMTFKVCHITLYSLIGIWNISIFLTVNFRFKGFAKYRRILLIL